MPLHYQRTALSQKERAEAWERKETKPVLFYLLRRIPQPPNIIARNVASIAKAIGRALAIGVPEEHIVHVQPSDRGVYASGLYNPICNASFGPKRPGPGAAFNPWLSSTSNV